MLYYLRVKYCAEHFNQVYHGEPAKLKRNFDSKASHPRTKVHWNKKKPSSRGTLLGLLQNVVAAIFHIKRLWVVPDAFQLNQIPVLILDWELWPIRLCNKRFDLWRVKLRVKWPVGKPNHYETTGGSSYWALNYSKYENRIVRNSILDGINIWFELQEVRVNCNAFNIVLILLNCTRLKADAILREF